MERALRSNNVELPAGSIDSSTRNFTVRAEGRLTSVEEFRDLVIRRNNNDLLRLGEVANVQMGVESDVGRLRANGQTAIGMGIIRQSKANTVAVSDGVRAELKKIRETLPPEVTIAESYDESIFIRASIKEVIITLAIAVSLVILVIFLFLRSWRATLIPAVTIPVCSNRCLYWPGFPWLFHQRTDVAGGDTGHRPRCRRCHRHVGEHPAPN